MNERRMGRIAKLYSFPSQIILVGLDLGDSKKFICVGALDDREVTTTFGKQLLMILCPFGKRNR